jgi:molecular chaperone GrpE (heat shock protein)
MANTQPATASIDTLQPIVPSAAYLALFDALGDAYWAASDLTAKDQIQGARDAVHRIITAINQVQLEADTAQLVTLTPYVTRTNEALKRLQADIANIVKRIEVAAEVESAIAKVLSLSGKLV